MSAYFHGYSEQEFDRLLAQSEFLANEIYLGVHLPEQGRLLEIGCGVGAQTRILSERFPGLSICSIDRNAQEIEQATLWQKQRPSSSPIEFICTEFEQWDSIEKFDAAFICWVLEHVPDPQNLLRKAAQHLKSGACIHITEVQNNSLYLFPPSPAIMQYWEAYCARQLKLNGNPNVGAHLRNCLHAEGFDQIQVNAHLMLRDTTQVEELKAMMDYWWNLMESVGDALVEEGFLTTAQRKATFEEIQSFHVQEGACFYYTFVQAEACRS